MVEIELLLVMQHFEWYTVGECSHCKSADLFHLQKHQSPHHSDYRLSDSNILMNYFLFFAIKCTSRKLHPLESVATFSVN